MTNAIGRAQRRALEQSLREHAFTPVAERERPLIGAEAEFLPIDCLTRSICAIDGPGPATGLGMLRGAATAHGWTECLSAKGTPQFTIPDGGTLGFEPGGQIEYSSPPSAGAGALLQRLRDTASALRAAAEPLGIELLTVGIEPDTPVERAPLRLHAPRYARMAEYFDGIGPFGARMMRQTAAFQVSIDLGAEPWRLWRVLNRMAPYLAAIFANSPTYAGAATGSVSYRAHCWRRVDPLRTGVREGSDDPAVDYCAFALAAPAMFLPQVEGAYRPMHEHLAAGRAGRTEWQQHLTTLFPEIRPRGTFEVRTCDAVAPKWFAAPLALLGGVAYDLAALRQADELLEAADSALLVRAGEVGLADPRIAAVARDLVILALDGCDALGEAFLAGADLDGARDFFDRYTFSGRAPADDVRPVPAAS